MKTHNGFDPDYDELTDKVLRTQMLARKFLEDMDPGQYFPRAPLQRRCSRDGLRRLLSKCEIRGIEYSTNSSDYRSKYQMNGQAKELPFEDYTSGKNYD